MKKNVLALSIATMIGGLGFAGAASADVLKFAESTAVDLKVAESGIGNALIVPYFTAQDGNMTVLHVTNTDTKNGKAVKVRFRGASNSDDILDFQLYLSPGDVWTGAVTKDAASGKAQLTTGDNSCTIPKVAGNAVPFVTGRLDPKLDAEGKANNTREGYVEIFNMADIPAGSPLYTTIKHVNGTAPCASSFMNAGFGSGLNQDFTTEAAAKAFGFRAPTGTLQGNWYIINVPNTTTFSGAATALKTVTLAGAEAPSNFVFFPQALEEVSTAALVGRTADPLLLAGRVKAGYYDLPDLSTPFVTALSATSARAQAAKLTNVLSAKTVRNQFVLDKGISGQTDWLLSMPTRRYSVALDYNGGNTATALYTSLSGFEAGVNGAWFTSGNTRVSSARQLCVSSSDLEFRDREERTATVDSSKPVFSPNTLPESVAASICGETYVVSFGDKASSVLGASVARQTVALPDSLSSVQNGWASLALNGNGLPVLGSAFIKVNNPNAKAGVSGNYGISWGHSLAK